LNPSSYNLCFLGFGNVNRTLAQLLLDREQELRERHGIVSASRESQAGGWDGLPIRMGWMRPYCGT